MTKPRVFVSSTYYDLKHLRSSLENFIESLGFEAILSEKGNIAYSPDVPLDESCYREAGDADIFVVIIGGRYGSEKSGKKVGEMPREFLDRYDSITKKEYASAIAKDVPTYIMVEKTVYSDYETFLENKDNELIKYAHVDSVNIFHLIDDILSQPRNNPIYQFDRYSDIEAWLREQWSGLFRELIRQRSKQTQISSLTSQVSQLSEITQTLKRYLEAVVSKVSPDDSAKIIADESKRLEESRILVELADNTFVQYIQRKINLRIVDIRDAISDSDSLGDLLNNRLKLDVRTIRLFATKINQTKVLNDVNEARILLGLRPFKPTSSKKTRQKKVE